jgi:hypothetical protein
MSVFTNLPQDMLQWEISRFLDPISRADFNAVLRPDEHVYKKLCSDYALKHHILVVKKSYDDIARQLNAKLRMLHNELLRKKNVEDSVNLLNRLFKFFLTPMNSSIISYQLNLKEMLVSTALEWQSDEPDLYEFISIAEKEELKKNALLMMTQIELTHFVRHVKIAKFKSVFSS